jgi:hypothetical protein
MQDQPNDAATVALTIPAECREFFDEVARTDVYQEPKWREESAALVAQLEPVGSIEVQVAPRLAYDILDCCIDGAGDEVRHVCCNVESEDLVAELEKATARMFAYAREIEKLERLEVPDALDV